MFLTSSGISVFLEDECVGVRRVADTRRLLQEAPLLLENQTGTVSFQRHQMRVTSPSWKGGDLVNVFLSLFSKFIRSLCLSRSPTMTLNVSKLYPTKTLQTETHDSCVPKVSK